MTDMLIDYLPRQKLADPDYIAALAAEYRAGKPYPHVCIDGLFDAAILAQVADCFPAQLSHEYDNPRERKFESATEAEIPLFIRYFLYALNSAAFINFCEQVTGLKGLIPDPHLEGSGLHQLPRGGKLAVHTDFNRSSRLKLDRRLNVLIYLNRDWLPEYGGEFEAWSPGSTQPEARYLPLFNRTILFNTNDRTFHGNPNPVNCPPGRSRQSIAMYYYTNGRPLEETSGLYQGTRFMDRPGENLVEPESLQRRLLRRMPRKIRKLVMYLKHEW